MTWKAVGEAGGIGEILNGLCKSCVGWGLLGSKMHDDICYMEKDLQIVGKAHDLGHGVKESSKSKGAAGS